MPGCLFAKRTISLPFRSMPSRVSRYITRTIQAQAAAATQMETDLGTKMTWPQFFATRRRLQLLKRFAGIPFAFSFWVAEGFILSLPIFDPTRTIFDMDPMVVVGLASVGGSLVSYFAGAALTSLVWRHIKSDTAKQLDEVFPASP